ncbi:MAG: HAD family hydrolase [Nanoarchaeota archaeon]
MVKVILFDFWGTLVENGVWSPCKQVKNILQIDLPFSDYITRMERVMMTSKFFELKDAFLAVANEFKVRMTPHQLELLIGMWNKSWMLAQPYKEVKEVLEKLKKEHTLVLVSNTDCFSEIRVLEKFGLLKYFDKTFYSYEMGLLKTDKRFFDQVLFELNVTLEDCVLVGDSLQSDIQAAKQANIKAILIDRKNLREFSPKIASLTELETALAEL